MRHRRQPSHLRTDGRFDRYVAFSCAGCGKSLKTEDGGASWVEEKNQ